MDYNKMVIIMRNDLNMRKGKMIAQGGHAVELVLEECDSSIDFSQNKRAWKKQGRTKICVQVNSEEELKEIYQKAKDANLPTCIILDSGRTEFGGIPTYTCAAIGPCLESLVNSITGTLKLL